MQSQCPVQSSVVESRQGQSPVLHLATRKRRVRSPGTRSMSVLIAVGLDFGIKCDWHSSSRDCPQIGAVHLATSPNPMEATLQESSRAETPWISNSSVRGSTVNSDAIFRRADRSRRRILARSATPSGQESQEGHAEGAPRIAEMRVRNLDSAGRRLRNGRGPDFRAVRSGRRPANQATATQNIATQNIATQNIATQNIAIRSCGIQFSCDFESGPALSEGRAKSAPPRRTRSPIVLRARRRLSWTACWVTPRRSAISCCCSDSR